MNDNNDVCHHRNKKKIPPRQGRQEAPVDLGVDKRMGQQGLELSLHNYTTSKDVRSFPH